jgi:hypothetical protein
VIGPTPARVGNIRAADSSVLLTQHSRAEAEADLGNLSRLAVRAGTFRANRFGR